MDNTVLGLTLSEWLTIAFAVVVLCLWAYVGFKEEWSEEIYKDSKPKKDHAIVDNDSDTVIYFGTLEECEVAVYGYTEDWWSIRKLTDNEYEAYNICGIKPINPRQ